MKLHPPPPPVNTSLQEETDEAVGTMSNENDRHRQNAPYLPKDSSSRDGNGSELSPIMGFERALTMDTEAESTIVSVATTKSTHDKVLSKQSSEKKKNMNLFDLDEIKWGAKLGKGTFAVVSEVKSFDLNNANRSFSDADDKRRRHMRDHPSRYAIKCLLPQKDKKTLRQAVTDLKTESSILSKMDHPNIIKLYAFRMDDNQNFIIIDRLTGTLEERIAQWITTSRRIRTEKLWSIWDTQNYQYSKAKRELLLERLHVAHNLASALAYLHEHGIVYRDLKPGNVGFDMDRYVKLFDFGLARALPNQPVGNHTNADDNSTLDDVYKMSGRVGTLLYMAPELWRCEPYNQKVDTYAFGHILWEILALDKPYSSYLGYDFQQDVFVQAVVDKKERPPLDKKWPVVIQELLPQTWQPRPQDRPSMTQVCAVLKNCIAGLQEAAERASSPGTSTSSSTKHKPNAGKRNTRKIRRSGFM